MTIAILARNSVGSPLAGLTPTWTAYYNGDTGATPTPPAISELSGGSYKFEPEDPLVNPSACGIIDLGGASVPRYFFFAAASSTVVPFAAWDENGQPLAGLTPTWSNLVRVSDGAAQTQPAISALGNGIYKTTYIAEHSTGAIDLMGGVTPVTAYPRYFHYDSEAAPTYVAPPVVSNLSPANGQPIYPDTPLQFDLTSTGGFAIIIPMISMDPFKVPEPTHNTDNFEPLYVTSTRVAISGGYRYTLRRKGGWYATPRLVIWAVSNSGVIWTGP